MNGKLPYEAHVTTLTKSTNVTSCNCHNLAMLLVNKIYLGHIAAVSLGKLQTNLQLLSMGESCWGQYVGFLNALDVSACIS